MVALFKEFLRDSIEIPNTAETFNISAFEAFKNLMKRLLQLTLC